MGPVALEDMAGSFLPGSGNFGNKEYSENMSARIDAEVSKIMNDAFAQAKEVLTAHRTALDAIADKLVEVETLERADFENLLIVNGITPKKEEESLIVA